MTTSDRIAELEREVGALRGALRLALMRCKCDDGGPHQCPPCKLAWALCSEPAPAVSPAVPPSCDEACERGCTGPGHSGHHAAYMYIGAPAVPPGGPVPDHVLKCWVEPFEQVRLGLKTFEFRKDDRNYQVGHVLRLMEFRQDIDGITGRSLDREVTSVLRGQFGVPDGYVVMSVREPSTPAATSTTGPRLDLYTLEEAARVCDSVCKEWRRNGLPGLAANRCAAAVRALAERGVKP